MGSFAELIEKGGPLMWPLLACSVLTIAVILERSVFFLRIKRNFKRFAADLMALVANRRIQAAQDFLRGRPDPSSLIAWTYLGNLDVKDELREEILQRVSSEQAERLERRVGMLSGLAHISPLLGLLGTVLGMIEAFRQIQQLSGQADAAALAGGIWEALLTTAFGLAIAIPAATAYHYFESLADRRISEMTSIVSVLNETLDIEPVKLAVSERLVDETGESLDAQA